MAKRVRNNIGRNELDALVKDNERRASFFNIKDARDKENLSQLGKELKREVAHVERDTRHAHGGLTIKEAAGAKTKAKGIAKVKDVAAAGVLGEPKVKKKRKVRRAMSEKWAKIKKKKAERERKQRKADELAARQIAELKDADHDDDFDMEETPTKSRAYREQQDQTELLSSPLSYASTPSSNHSTDSIPPEDATDDHPAENIPGIAQPQLTKPTPAELTFGLQPTSPSQISEHVFKPNIRLIMERLENYEFQVYAAGWNAYRRKGINRARFEEMGRTLMTTHELRAAHERVVEGSDLLEMLVLAKDAAATEEHVGAVL